MSVNACNGVPTTGRCLDTTTVATCVVGTDNQPRLMQNSCAAGSSCVTESGQSYCKVTATCREGQSSCVGTSSRQVCTQGSYQTMACAAGTACRAFPGLGASCVTPGTDVAVQGTLRYERRLPNLNYSGYAQPTVTPAPGVFVELIDGTEVLGSGSCDANGLFNITAYRPPSTSGQLLFVPVAFHADDSPAYGVAIATDGDTVNTASGMWSFTSTSLPQPVGGVISAGTQTIAAENSGAINIFEAMGAHVARMTSLFGRAPLQSMVALWKPGIDMFCLACFINRSGGGTAVGTGALPLRFDNTILFSGSTMSPLHWSASVVNHEIGHFVMNEYGLPPGEGGTHYFNQVESPGLAWSEGYATWDGQAALSVGLSSPNPRYFAVQQGTAFSIDISKATSTVGTIPEPDPAGPIDQQIGEIIISAIAWDLWRAAGDTPIFTSIALPRVTGTLNRGYKTVDLVDFADAVQCAGRATPTQVAASLTKFKFPWDNKPLCP